VGTDGRPLPPLRPDAEADRKAGALHLYVDGKLDKEQDIQLAGSLANASGLLVGDQNG